LVIPAAPVAARRIANLLVERLDLTPPVDVQALLEAEADLHRVDWPYGDVDAIVTGFADSDRPTVFLRATENLLRERFTIAHELGHLTLPWHLPTPNCSVDEGEFETQDPTIEQQADLFASTLLVPDRWLAGLMNKHADDMTRVIQELNAAEVSTAAALEALRRYLLAGWAFLAYGGRSTVMTRGTHLSTASVTRASLMTEAKATGEASLNGGTVRWFKFTTSTTPPVKSFDDDRTDHAILMDAIIRSGVPSDEHLRISQSANGKVGGTLRDAAGRPAGETYEAMIHKLADWEYAALLANDDFRLWVGQKARAIEAGSTKRKR
jgi:hypothetical protein